jgi:hypothetical protein
LGKNRQNLSAVSAFSAVNYYLIPSFSRGHYTGFKFFKKARFRFILKDFFATDVRQERYQCQSEAFLEMCFHALPGLHRMTPEIYYGPCCVPDEVENLDGREYLPFKRFLELLFEFPPLG